MREELKQLRGQCSIRQALFCEAIVKGSTKDKAYLEAGYDTKDKAQRARNANRLLTMNDKVRAYVDALRAEGCRISGFTRAKAQQMLDDAYAIAKQARNPVAMVSAVRALAALYGLEREQAPNPEAPGADMPTAERKRLEALAARVSEAEAVERRSALKLS